VGRSVERARSAAAVGGEVAAVGVQSASDTPADVSCATSPAAIEGHPIALEHARDGVRRAQKIRESLGPSPSLGDLQVAARLERDAVALLSRCEAAREMTPAEILRSSAWRRVERVLVEAAGTLPGGQRVIGEALARLAAEGE
jgi:hypothetical protein